jgi:hypothetical protein
MIHEFARCPFCSYGVLAIDDSGPTFIIEPQIKKGRPCPHLALAIASFEATSDEGPVQQSGVWRWSRGEGLVGPDAQGDVLGDYLTDLVCVCLPWRELIPKVPYQLVGVSAGEREAVRKGWGYFPVLAGKKVLEGSIDGWALYSHEPEDLLRDVHERLGLWMRMSAEMPHATP